MPFDLTKRVMLPDSPDNPKHTTEQVQALWHEVVITSLTQAGGYKPPVMPVENEPEPQESFFEIDHRLDREQYLITVIGDALPELLQRYFTAKDDVDFMLEYNKTHDDVMKIGGSILLDIQLFWNMAIQLENAVSNFRAVYIVRDVLHKRYGLPARKDMTWEQKEIAAQIEVRMREDAELVKQGKYRCLWTGIITDLPDNWHALDKAKQHELNQIVIEWDNKKYSWYNEDK